MFINKRPSTLSKCCLLAAVVSLPTTSLQAQAGPALNVSGAAGATMAGIEKEIAVTADAVIFLPPDAAEVRIAVDASAPTAQAAQALAAEKMGMAVDTARKVMPPGSAVSEDGLKFAPANTAGGTVTVSQMSTVSLTALEKTGSVIDALTKGTGVRLVSVRYFVRDRTSEKAAANRDAVERARKKAEAAAAAAGLTLGSVTSINLVEETANKLVRLREAQGEAEQYTGGEDYQVIAAVSFSVAK